MMATHSPTCHLSELSGSACTALTTMFEDLRQRLSHASKWHIAECSLGQVCHAIEGS